MREHVINIQLRISARDSITRADLMGDLRKQLTMIQEQAPYRSSDGASWWTNSNSAVAALNYENVGEQLAYEAEQRAEDAMRAEVADSVPVAMWQCEDCGWTCSANPHVPLEEAECDNCGGELVPTNA